MEQIKEIIIIGGGKSIQTGLESGLQDKIKDKCVILINYAYKHFEGTFLCFGDKNFYTPESVKTEKGNPDIYEELGKLPLIIGAKKNTDLDSILHPNTFLIHSPRAKELGIAPVLTGLFALSLAEKLNPEKIFLLGFDWNRRDPTTIPLGKDYNPKSDLDVHYYGKEIKHKGSGYFGMYENHNPNNYFKIWDKCKSKIYNVNPASNIENFKKIDYTEMYNLLSEQIFNQEELRNEIKIKLISK
jgi:hypothetical protein